MLDTTSPAEARRELEADVTAMKRLGVKRWKDIELTETAFVVSDPETQRSTDPDEEVAIARAERRRVALASSGGPVKALGGSIR